MQEREVTQNNFQNIPIYDKQSVSLVLLTPNLVAQWLGFLVEIQESHEGWYHETLCKISQSCHLQGLSRNEKYKMGGRGRDITAVKVATLLCLAFSHFLLFLHLKKQKFHKIKFTM
jgi:hypothetical protein